MYIIGSPGYARRLTTHIYIPRARLRFLVSPSGRPVWFRHGMISAPLCAHTHVRPRVSGSEACITHPVVGAAAYQSRETCPAPSTGALRALLSLFFLSWEGDGVGGSSV